MKYNKRFLISFVMILLFIAILSILLVSIFKPDRLMDTHHIYNLKKDGVVIQKNVLNPQEIGDLKEKCEKGDYEYVKRSLLHNAALNSAIHKILGNDYQFQDYVWIIQKSVVHTCHRDNNGDFFNENQKHPSYTMLVYLEDMEKCLGVIPTSHKEEGSFGVNMTDHVVNLLCHKGDMILFNANLIHVGTINKKADHLRIQLKVTHKDDLKVLHYYQNFNKILNTENTIPQELQYIQKNISCMFPFVSDMTQGENINTARGSVEGADIGIFQQMFSYLFYGNSRFYDLPNAF